MADFDIQEISQTPTIAPTSDSVFSIREQHEKQIQINQNVEESTVGEKMGAAWDNAKEVNFIAGGAELLDRWTTEMGIGFEDDPNFVMDDEMAVEILQQNGLPMDAFGDIRETTSETQLRYRVRKLKEQVSVEENIMNTLTNNEMTASTLVGSIVDIDLAVGLATGGLTSGAKVSASVARAFAINASIESIAATVKYNLSDSYTVEDGFFDVFVGTAVGTGGAVIGNNMRKRLLARQRGVIDSPNGVDNPVQAIDDALEQARQQGKVRPMWDEETINANRKSFFAKQEAYGKSANQADKTKLADELDEIELAHSKSLSDIEEMNYRIVREQELKPLRRETYETNRKSFFAKQRQIELDALAKQIDEATDPLVKANLQKQFDEKMGKVIDDIDTSATQFIRILDEMDGDVKKLTDDLDTFVKEVGEEEFIKVIDGFRKDYPEEIELIEDMLTKPMDESTLKTFVDRMKEMGYAPKAVTAMAVLMGGSSMVHAGEDEIKPQAMITGLFLVAASLVLTPSIVKGIRNKAIARKVTNIRDGWNNSALRAEQLVSKDASQFRKIMATVSDALHTRITSTVEPIRKAGIEAEKIVDKLLYSTKNGTGAEIDKQSWVHSTMDRYNTAETTYLKEWLAEKNISRTASYFDEEKNIYRFREDVADAVELIPNKAEFDKLPESIKKMAREYDALKKEIYDRATEYGVKGFVDEVKADGTKVKGVMHEEGMIPRYWKPAEMNRILNATDDVGEETIRAKLASAFDKKFKGALKNVYYYKDKDGVITTSTKQLKNTSKTLVKTEQISAARQVADMFVDDWKSGRNLTSTGIRRGEDIYQAIESLLKDDVDITDLSNALAVPKDISARAKSRIALDVNDIPEFDINIDGVKTHVTKANFVERDAKVILDRTANSLYGQSAIAKGGWKTTSALEKVIDDIPDAKVRKELRQITDLVLGVPIPSNSPFMHEISMIAKDMSIVAKLPLVLFSTPPEVINAITHQGVLKSLRNTGRLLKNLFGKVPKDSNLAEMIKMSGLGTSVNRLDFTGFRGFTDQAGDLDDVTALSMIRNGTMKMRDFSIYLNQLGRMGDVLQKAGMEMNLEKIANFLHKQDVSPTGIEVSRMKQWGIDEEFIAEFKNKITLNPDGTVKKMNSDSWSIKSRDKFASVLRIMNQQVSPETTIGEIPLFARTTDLGRAMTGLITYPIMQFNEYGLNDLRHLDRRAAIHSMGAFMGAYIGLKAKYAMLDKDVEEEMIILYALLNVPQAGAYTSIRGMLDPAMFGIAKDAHNLVVPEAMEAM